jgi:CheY-like chemotaxis protein
MFPEIILLCNHVLFFRLYVFEPQRHGGHNEAQRYLSASLERAANLRSLCLVVPAVSFCSKKTKKISILYKILSNYSTLHTPNNTPMAYILAVDDTRDILDALVVIMTMQGHEVKGVSTKAELLKELSIKKPDVILLDVYLNYADGREICREIKQLPEYNSIGIILISASPKLLDNFHDCKADAILEKPFDLSHLVKLVDGFVQGKSIVKE